MKSESRTARPPVGGVDLGPDRLHPPLAAEWDRGPAHIDTHKEHGQVNPILSTCCIEASRPCFFSAVRVISLALRPRASRLAPLASRRVASSARHAHRAPRTGIKTLALARARSGDARSLARALSLAFVLALSLLLRHE